MKKFIFGLGTGRCGTHSLQSLLNQQSNSNVTHEFGDIPALTWSRDKDMYRRQLKRIESRREHFVGDVGFYWLPYVEELMNDCNPKIIVLKRNKQETIESYMKKTIGRNHWQTHDGQMYRSDHWDRCYPKYICESKEKAIGLYWEEYYKTCQILSNRYPNNIKIYDINSLNKSESVEEILNFCDLEIKKIIVGTKVEAR
jgi:hypothetical protein